MRYTYKLAGFEQDVILRSQPPAPDTFGLNQATTKLEVFTEFLNPPSATVTPDTGSDGSSLDETIAWGATQIGQGNAFDVSDQPDTSGVAVEKRYVTIQGRNVLVEMVPLKAVAASLDLLPQQSSINKAQPVLAKSDVDIVPAARKKANGSKPIKLAYATPPSKGYLLDYTRSHLINTSTG